MREIYYCPVCGKPLKLETERKNKDFPRYAISSLCHMELNIRLVCRKCGFTYKATRANSVNGIARFLFEAQEDTLNIERGLKKAQIARECLAYANKLLGKEHCGYYSKIVDATTHCAGFETKNILEFSGDDNYPLFCILCDEGLNIYEDIRYFAIPFGKNEITDEEWEHMLKIYGSEQLSEMCGIIDCEYKEAWSIGTILFDMIHNPCILPSTLQECEQIVRDLQVHRTNFLKCLASTKSKINAVREYYANGYQPTDVETPASTETSTSVTVTQNNIKPIQTRYNGHKFRSRLEARWAVFFDAIGVEWEYEPEGFVLEGETCYLPDFLLHNVKGVAYNSKTNEPSNGDLYVEVKGNLTEEDAQKIEKFGATNTPIFVVGAIPKGKDLEELIVNTRIANSQNYLSYSWETMFPDCSLDSCVFPCADKQGGLLLFTDSGGCGLINRGGTLEEKGLIDAAATVTAYNKARQARFEFEDSEKK